MRRRLLSPFLLLFGLTLGLTLGFSQNTFATMELINVSGVSSFTPGTTAVIFGGYTGTMGECGESPSATSTCNSCKCTACGAEDFSYCGVGNKRYCNPTSIHPDLRMVVEYKTTATVSQATSKLRVTFNSEEVTPISGETVFTNGGTSSFKVLWKDLCVEATGTSAACEKSFSESLKIEVDAGNDSTFEESLTVEVRLRVLNDTDEPALNNYHSPECSGTPSLPNQGFCDFGVLPGDTKVYLNEELLQVQTNSTGGGDVLYKGARFFYQIKDQLNPAGDFCGINIVDALSSGRFKDVLLTNNQASISPGSAVPLSTKKIEGLENKPNDAPGSYDRPYYFTMASIDEAGNLSYFSDPTGYLNVGEHTATPSEVAGLLSEQKCFIATAALYDEDQTKVFVLRKFRDQILLKSEAGKAFVGWYYSHSPAWANWLLQNEEARQAVRFLLAPLATAAHYALQIQEMF